jgi:hypothetical protein
VGDLPTFFLKVLSTLNYDYQQIMKKILLFIFIAFIFAGCVLNKVTGRKQLSLVQESELQLMAVNQYNAFLSENKVLPASNKDAAMVDRVGARISKAITQ